MLLTIIILTNEACTLNRTKDLLISIHNPPQLLSIARSPLPSNNHQISNLGFRLNSSFLTLNKTPTLLPMLCDQNNRTGKLGFGSILRSDLSSNHSSLQRAATIARTPSQRLTLNKTSTLLLIARSTQSNWQARVWLISLFQPRLRPELTPAKLQAHA